MSEEPKEGHCVQSMKDQGESGNRMKWAEARSQRGYKPLPGNFLRKGNPPGEELLKMMISFAFSEGLWTISCFIHQALFKKDIRMGLTVQKSFCNRVDLSYCSGGNNQDLKTTGGWAVLNQT